MVASWRASECGQPDSAAQTSTGWGPSPASTAGGREPATSRIWAVWEFAGVAALVKQMAQWLTGLGRPDSSG